MFRFENQIAIYLLILIPVLFIGFIIIRKQVIKRLNRFAGNELVGMLLPDWSKYKPWLRFSLYSIALGLIIVGLANPQIGTRVSEAKRKGIDLIVLLDISNSMKAEDIKPNRLEKAKQVISRLIDKMETDRIGIVVFAGDAFVQLPLTTDYAAAKLFMSVIETDLITLQGTAIGKAIDLSLESFKTQEGTKKAMLIFSDGENHEDDAESAATEAAKQGFVVHTIGMGTINGGPVPIIRNGQNVGYLKDNDGGIVTTSLNPDMLQQIAHAGNGQMILAGGEDADLSKLMDKLSGIEKKEYKSTLFTDYEDRFQYVFALAFVFLIFELFVSDKINPLFKKIINFVESGRRKVK